MISVLTIRVASLNNYVIFKDRMAKMCIYLKNIRTNKIFVSGTKFGFE